MNPPERCEGEPFDTGCRLGISGVPINRAQFLRLNANCEHQPSGNTQSYGSGNPDYHLNPLPPSLKRAILVWQVLQVTDSQSTGFYFSLSQFHSTDMKFTLTTFSLVILSNIVLAQNLMEEPLRNSCQLSSARAFTLHYQSPVQLSVCFEGCMPETQRALLSPTYTLNYYRQIYPKHSLRLGIGITEYRFSESGLSSDGANGYYPYKDIQNYLYTAYLLGHRYMVTPRKVISPFLESTATYESAGGKGGIFYSLSGVSIQLATGVSWRLTPSVSIMLSGFYKSAIMNYYHGNPSRRYYPFSYGMEFSVLFFMF